ncbi:hypothetical protein F5B20DRAFT_586092 [Whalleya microplaca]|nr:hypothetical protein F5B20DRAFT_586092 [Whalleya microplaca]
MSRYSQSREYGVSSDLNRTTTRQYPPPPPRGEFMQAHDLSFRGRQGAMMSNSTYQTMERASARVPELENGRKKSGNDRSEGHHGLSRWLGKHKDKPKHEKEKLVISSPMPISPRRVPQRPARPPIEQTPASFYGMSTLQESRAPVLPPKPPVPPKDTPSTLKLTIRRENLGTAREALGSHPVKWLNSAQRQYPAERILTPSAAKDRNRQTVIYSDTESGVAPTKPEVSAQLKAERRKGRVFQSGPLLAELQGFQEFPDPQTFDGQDDGEFWEDAGINDDSEVLNPETEDGDPEMTIIPEQQKEDGLCVPELTITAPEKTDNSTRARKTRSGRPSKPLLDVDDAYERLFHRQEKETRKLRQLLPLAWLVADIEGIEPTDIGALTRALQGIIDDNDKLWKLWPLAMTLAEDQGLDLEDFKAFPQALQKVLADRDSAQRAAYHHMARERQLEGRVRQMQREQERMQRERMSRYQDHDQEDYIR